MELVCMIDPERITSRVFGGPRFACFQQDGPTHIKSLDGTKRWAVADVQRAWFESRNAAPELLGSDVLPERK